MDLKSKIQNDMKAALKAQEAVRLNAIRMLVSEIKKREIDKRGPLTDSEIVRTLSTLIKQRNEAIDLYTKGNRPELADKERQEIGFLSVYLPPPLSDVEVDDVVRAVVTELNAQLPKDRGRVMKAAVEKAADRADGKRISQAVERLMGQQKS